MTEDLIIYRKTIPAREPEYADFPEKLHPNIVKFLKNHGIEKLYIHQTEAYEQAAEGKNLVITTPTASGKSLCFYLHRCDSEGAADQGAFCLSHEGSGGGSVSSSASLD